MLSSYKEKLLQNLSIFTHFNGSMYSDTYLVLLTQSRVLLSKLADKHTVQRGSEEVKFTANWVISLIGKVSERCLTEKDGVNASLSLYYNKSVLLLSSLLWYFTAVNSSSSNSL